MAGAHDSPFGNGAGGWHRKEKDSGGKEIGGLGKMGWKD